MTKKMKYPMEAFALAAVLFSAGMKEAMIVGIGLVFGDVLQYVLREFFKKQYANTISAVGAALTCGAMYLMSVLVGITPGAKQVIGFAVLGLLLVKHQESKKDSDENTVTDYNAVLTADAIAYGFYVLLAIVREYLAGATIFGFNLPETAIVSSSYGKPMLALIGAGIMAALINRVLKADSDANAGLWVGIPAILLEVPFVWNHAPEWIGTIVGVAVVGVIYVTLRKKLVFSNTEKHIEGLSVELVMLGIIYMIFGLL